MSEENTTMVVVIETIVGAEPNRQDEYPMAFTVGTKFKEKEVIEITHRVENRGDHGVGWYDIWVRVGEDRKQPIYSMNERHVAEVYYKV